MATVTSKGSTKQQKKQIYNQRFTSKYKGNRLYMILIGEMYYFGYTTIPLANRKGVHISKSRKNKGNPTMRKLFKELGEKDFVERFKIMCLGTYNTKAEARDAEKFLLKIYYNQPNCMNEKK
jgi:hypothetical protein